MNPAEQKKPQLHQSHLNMLYRCGEQFRRVYIMGHRERPSLPKIIGSTTHEVAKENLNFKIANKGALLPIEQIRDLARDSFLKIWDSSPVVLNEQEAEAGIQKVKGDGIDVSIALSELHYRELAPNINPIPGGVERPWVIEAKGFPFDLAGTIDIDEGSGIRDTKTRNRFPGPVEAQTSEQLTLYAMAKKIIDKIKDRVEVALDILVKPTDSKHARFVTYQSSRGMADFVIAKKRFERAVEIIEKEAYTPASRSDWWCSDRFCGFAADGSCPFYNGKISVSMSSASLTTKTGGGNHGNRSGRKIIGIDSRAWWDAVR